MKSLLLSLLVLFTLHINAQTFTISGKVVDKISGESLVGANVSVVGTYLVAPTDKDGEFVIPNLKSGLYTLSVTYIGFEKLTKEVKLFSDSFQDLKLVRSRVLTDEVIVTATKAGDKTPTTYVNLEQEEIERKNLGKDLPYIIEHTPSVVAHSDAGNGIGYTSMRIRGSDITRINVTMNGIPLNDAESHGVWWVNLPDFSSSLDNIQVQRGIGTSTNGAGAFGATLNMQTNTLSRKAYGEIISSYGSFNTYRNTVKLGTGLIKNHWTVDGRLSLIQSDGYIDRASSDLRSFFISGGYYGKNTIIRANIFSGKEKTYQAWNGVPEDSLSTNRTFNVYTYDNETDNYNQDHYQFLLSQQINPQLNLNAALHYTKGAGYFEQFREEEDFEEYGLDTLFVGGDTIHQTDLIRRRWLDNDFYGVTFSLNYDINGKMLATIGGGWNTYEGRHFGEIIWAEHASNSQIRDRYYNNIAEKNDFNIYAKINYQLSNKINLWGDIQYRTIDYSFFGFNDSLVPAQQQVDHKFVNPKGGFTINLNSTHSIYGSFAMASREPVRDDYVESSPVSRPLPEELMDAELGYHFKSSKASIGLNLFYMIYKNQLVLTGQINDVGAYTRTNVDDSYRTGAELVASFRFSPIFIWDVNFTYSMNKIKAFEEFVDDFDNGGQITNSFTDTDIALSPSMIGSSQITLIPVKGLRFQLISKYVGDQFLDNTSNSNRMLVSFMTHDIQLSYSIFPVKFVEEITFRVQAYNLLDEQYSATGYTFSYISGGNMNTSNFHFPQAGRHYLGGIVVKL